MWGNLFLPADLGRRDARGAMVDVKRRPLGGGLDFGLWVRDAL